MRRSACGKIRGQLALEHFASPCIFEIVLAFGGPDGFDQPADISLALELGCPKRP